MSGYGFVVLNYCGADETIRCVQSIFEALKEEKYYVIIVDNGSTDTSLIKLENAFDKSDNVFILSNEKNLGFSSGMNKGFVYAKHQLNCDYIVLVNNDIEIKTPNTIKYITEDYRQYDYAVLGPTIINSDKNEYATNPFWGAMMSIPQKKRDLIKSEFYARFRLFLTLCGLLTYYDSFAKSIKSFIKKKRNSDRKNEDSANEVILNVALHGAFLVFSPKYVEKYDGLAEVTFLYGEEWILYNRCNQNNWIMVYDPRIVVHHKGNNVLKNEINDDRKRTLYQYKQLKLSRKKTAGYIKSIESLG